MEYLGVYDENGVYMGKKIARGDKNLAENEYIKLAVVWLKCKGKYLIQKSSAQKGSDYAVSGGHVPDGITSQEQASVELEEELGLKVQEEDLTFVGNIKLPHCIFDVYLYQNDNLDKAKFTLQEEEVESAEWYSEKEIEELINKGVFRNSSRLQYEKFFKPLEKKSDDQERL